MDLGRIYTLREELGSESVSWGELAEITDAGSAIGLDIEGMSASDVLDELEAHATTVEKVIYEWVKENFGEAEANDPSWSTSQLAKEINKIPVIFGVEDSQLGKLLGETE